MVPNQRLTSQKLIIEVKGQTLPTILCPLRRRLSTGKRNKGRIILDGLCPPKTTSDDDISFMPLVGIKGGPGTASPVLACGRRKSTRKPDQPEFFGVPPPAWHRRAAPRWRAGGRATWRPWRRWLVRAGAGVVWWRFRRWRRIRQDRRRCAGRDGKG